MVFVATEPASGRRLPPGRVSLDGPSPRRGMMIVAVVVLAVAALAATFTQVWNYDVFWHLAGGEWMFRNGRVLGTDPFSIDPLDEWINVHWLFQLVVTGLHRLGGYAALTCLKAGLAVATLVVLALSLRRVAPPWWIIIAGLAAIFVMADRFRVRPEAFTLAFLAVTIALLERVRRGRSPATLWLLAPLMLVWANMHGLYILGVGLIWSAALGAAIDLKLGRNLAGRLLSGQALAPLVVATFMPLVSPWPIDSAAQPLLLWTRISGQVEYYTYAVTELLPTWQAWQYFGLHIAVVAATLAAMIANRRAVPVAHCIWLAALAGLAGMAIRNLGLLGPVCGYLLGLHGGQVLIGFLKRRPWAARATRPANVAAVLLAALTTAGYASEWIHHAQGTPRQFGPGIEAMNYPVAAAEFLAGLPADGDILCVNFGDAGPFMYHAWPKRRVWMDGRLEAHTLERFIAHQQVQNQFKTASSAGAVELPPSVRFVVVSRKYPQHLQAVSAAGRFDLLYIDPAAAVFARRDFRPAGALVADRKPVNLARYDRPVGPDGLVDRTPGTPRKWYRQNPLSASARLAELFYWLSVPELDRPSRAGELRLKLATLAVRYAEGAQLEGVVEPNLAMANAAHACIALAMRSPDPPDRNGAIDANLARALYLLNRVDLTELGDTQARRAALGKVLAFVRSRQFDAAAAAVEQAIAALGPAERVNPPLRYIQLRDRITARLAASQAQVAAADVSALPPVERATFLASADVGLTDAAIAQLRASLSQDVRANLLLAGLLVRKGRPGEARTLYNRVRRTQPDSPAIAARLALCDWAEGKRFEALAGLEALAEPDRSEVLYYLADLRRQLGR